MQNYRKNVNGITLIALVVTIIILLILAGISIGMLSGDNGILGRAGNAKTQTDIAEEKEIIDLAVLHAAGKSKYGDIDETYFKNELEKNNATAIKKGSKYKVTFSSGRQYEVDQDGNVKEKKVNPNAIEITELNVNASTYFGWDVINYAETLPENLQDTKWQLFYAGKLDETDENEEERIYLISKGCIQYTLLPKKNGAALEITDNTAGFAKFGSNTSSGIMQQYTGSSDISTQMQKYNKDYFKDYTSTNPNMKALAYMLDTTIWSPFATSSKNYADYAMGGPSIELLFTAYNKYASTHYEADAISLHGYQVRKSSENNFSNSIDDAIINDTNLVDNPYSVKKNMGRTDGNYWIASPNYAYSSDLHLMKVSYKGDVGDQAYLSQYNGFRPIVLLNSNYTLEKTKDLNDNDAFIIVEQ